MICDLALRFGENGAGDSAIMSRPFGVALLIAGFDEKGPHLFFADPSGTFMRYGAKAIGSASEVAQSQLQDEYKKEMSTSDALNLSVKILKQVMEDKIDATNSQFAVVDKTGFRFLSPMEVSLLIKNLTPTTEVFST